MTTQIGFYFMILVLVMVPLVFLGAGKETTLRREERKQCQQDALLDWTDKDALAVEHDEAAKMIPAGKAPASSVTVEIICRGTAGTLAA